LQDSTPRSSSQLVPTQPEQIQLDESNSLAERQAKMRARGEDNSAATRVDPNLRPYKIEDLMVLHNLSRQTVIRLYENEADIEIVPKLGSQGRRCTGRRCRTIRVPKHVYLRVRNKMRAR
jgi:hypothetical protein